LRVVAPCLRRLRLAARFVLAPRHGLHELPLLFFQLFHFSVELVAALLEMALDAGMLFFVSGFHARSAGARALRRVSPVRARSRFITRNVATPRHTRVA